MIQMPEVGEVVAEIPGRGPMVSFNFGTMQRVFGEFLAKGRVVEIDGRRAIEWLVDGAARVPGDDPRVRAVAARLRELCEEAQATARELGDRIARHERSSDPSMPLRIPRELAKRMGAQADRDTNLYPEAEVRPLQQGLLRMARAVSRAVDRGDFVVREGRVLLIGWGFLRREEPDFEPNFPKVGTVTLRLLPDEVQPDRVIQALEYVTSGSAESVELVRADGVESVVADTARSLNGPVSQDIWRFPLGQLADGARFQARARGAWGTIYSEVVEIPRRATERSLPPAPPPIEPLDEPVTPKAGVAAGPAGSAVRSKPVPRMPVVGPPVPEPIRQEPRKVSRWVWILLALLLLTLLTFLLWLLLPFGTTRANWTRVRSAEHLPRAVADVDPEPMTRSIREAPGLTLPPSFPLDTRVVEYGDGPVVVAVPPGGVVAPGTYVVPSDGGVPVYVAPPGHNYRPGPSAPPASPVPPVPAGHSPSAGTRSGVASAQPDPATPSPTAPDAETPAHSPNDPAEQSATFPPPPSSPPKSRRKIPWLEGTGVSGSGAPAVGREAPPAEAPPAEAPPAEAPPAEAPPAEAPPAEAPPAEAPPAEAPPAEAPPAETPNYTSADDASDNVPSPSDFAAPEEVDADQHPPDALHMPSSAEPVEQPQEEIERRMRFSWDISQGGLLVASERSKRDGVSAVIAFAVDPTLAQELPVEPERAREWARERGFEILDLAALEGAENMRVLAIDARRQWGSAGRATVEIPCTARELVLGLRFESPRGSDASLDGTVMTASPPVLLRGAFHGSTEGWKLPDGNPIELVRLPITQVEGADDLRVRFLDGVYRFAPITIECVESSATPTGGGV
jgi:hypothetical protein